MQDARDDFSKDIKETLAKRVGFRCSNPNCRQATSGPQENSEKSINIGVAAHITAAANGGPRYDSTLNSEQRKNINNGIWLCQSCAKLVDSDEQRYTVEFLKKWKSISEEAALLELEITGQHDKSPKVVVESSPGAVVQINENGDNIINKPKVGYQPRIVFFQNDIKFEKDSSGNIMTTFLFGSEDGFPLMNPLVHIYFDREFVKVLGAVVGTTEASAGNLQKDIIEGNKEYIISTNILKSGNYLRVQTISREEIKINGLTMKP